MGQGREKALKIAGNTLEILAGTAVYALAVVAFLLPSGIITGGTTGLALIARHFWASRSSFLCGLSTRLCFCSAGQRLAGNLPLPPY